MIIKAGTAVFDGECDGCGVYRHDLAYVPGFADERYGVPSGYFCPGCVDGACGEVAEARRREEETWDTEHTRRYEDEDA